MATEILLTTFGPEDETGYRRGMDHYQIPPDRRTWKYMYGAIRDIVGPDGAIFMYRASVGPSRELISVSPTPWRVR